MAVLSTGDNQFHPFRAAFWCVIAVLLIAMGLQLYWVHSGGWVPSGAYGQSFQIDRRIRAGGMEIGPNGETSFLDTYQFSYTVFQFQHPVLKDRCPTAIWVHFEGITKIRDNLNQRDRPQPQPVLFEDLPEDVLREYEANAAEWVRIITTLSPNEVLLGTTLDSTNSNLFTKWSTRREKLWTSGRLIDMLQSVGSNALVAVVVIAPPLYFIGYWFIFRAIIVLRRHVQGRCVQCSYPLPCERCPECGTINKLRRVRPNGPC